jgi:hypothetical protein
MLTIDPSHGVRTNIVQVLHQRENVLHQLEREQAFVLKELQRAHGSNTAAYQRERDAYLKKNEAQFRAAIAEYRQAQAELHVLNEQQRLTEETTKSLSGSARQYLPEHPPVITRTYLKEVTTRVRDAQAQYQELSNMLPHDRQTWTTEDRLAEMKARAIVEKIEQEAEALNMAIKSGHISVEQRPLPRMIDPQQDDTYQLKQFLQRR